MPQGQMGARVNVNPHQRLCIMSAVYNHQHKTEAVAKSRKKVDKPIKEEAQRCMVKDLHRLYPELVLLIPD